MERQRRVELASLNRRAWSGEKDVLKTQEPLDSSMKKNTAFIKRLRTALVPSGLNTFIQEVNTLSLHKYLSEIISACYEGLCKVKAAGEIATAVEVTSALHQRFGPDEFTKYIGWLIGRGLSTPDKSQLKGLAVDVREREEKERLARHKILLRVATELWLVGVLRGLDDVSRPEDASARTKENAKTETNVKAKARSEGETEPFPLEVLKDMLSHDREHVHLPLVSLWLRSFAWDVLGVQGIVEGRKTADDEAPDTEPLTPPELRTRFTNIMTRYFDDVKLHIKRDHKTIAAQGKRNAEAYVKSGEVFEDRQANYDRQLKAQERLLANAQVLADSIGAEMPNLEEKDHSSHLSDGSIGLIKTGEYLKGYSEGAGIWEDEEERRFYENLVDLKDRVPGILLDDGKKKKQETDEQTAKRAENNGAGPETAEPTANQSQDLDDQTTTIINKSVGAKVDALLARLPDLVSKDTVDQLAMDFCFLNSKASRNRLIKGIQEPPKGRSDLLPLYARLVATLGKYMPDVTTALVNILDDEFRSLQRRKQKEFLGQVRSQNVRYLAELTKFGVVPEHVIFHSLKICLDDFSRVSIEVLCNLLENCGRYLLRNQDTAPRMGSFLEVLQRKKGAQHLAQQERMLIENAMYFVNPPERAAIQQKERTPMELFIRKLIYLDLNKRNVEKVAKQLRKLHWEEPEVVHLLEKTFSRPGKVKYSSIHLLAIILQSLNRYHQDFIICVTDNVLESIALGLETNDFRFNQRRISEVKYLGELYIYRVVDNTVIFDTLNRILAHGHENGWPHPGAINVLDPPDDYFRIRLVCSLLETCGMFFDKGGSKKKLDFFLTFLQYYCHTKESLPMNVDFLIKGMYSSIRPEWIFASTFEEARQSLSQAVRDNFQQTDTPSGAEPDGGSSSDEIDREEEDEQQVRPRAVKGQTSTADEADATGGETPSAISESEDEQIVVTRQESERDPEEEADFDRDLAKMMADSLDSRKHDRKSTFDVPLPMKRLAREDDIGPADDEREDPPEEVVQVTKFALLSKRGNRQQTRNIDLPSDSTFALAMLSQQEAEKAEQQRIKNLVLNYDLRDEREGDGGDYDISFPLSPNRNRRQESRPSTKSAPKIKNAKTSLAVKGNDRQQVPHVPGRLDKAGTSRSNQRARKLQLSDVNWT